MKETEDTSKWNDNPSIQAKNVKIFIIPPGGGGSRL